MDIVISTHRTLRGAIAARNRAIRMQRWYDNIILAKIHAEPLDVPAEDAYVVVRGNTSRSGTYELVFQDPSFAPTRRMPIA